MNTARNGQSILAHWKLRQRESFGLNTRSKEILLNLFQLLVLVTPLLATGLWAAPLCGERSVSEIGSHREFGSYNQE